MRDLLHISLPSLNHFTPSFHFHNVLIMSDNQRFAYVFSGYRNGTLTWNGLSKFNPLSTNLTRWPNTQTIRRQLPTNYWSAFNHFLGLALKRLSELIKKSYCSTCLTDFKLYFRESFLQSIWFNATENQVEKISYSWVILIKIRSEKRVWNPWNTVVDLFR